MGVRQIKFNCNWIPSDSTRLDKVAELNVWRNITYERGMIGVYPDGVGFGNISVRCEGNTFLISGSAAGGLRAMNESHYSLVTEFDLDANRLTCVGPIRASSESLTHAMIYECSLGTNAVIHVRNLARWERLMDRVPSTRGNISYGTTEMANEIKRLFKEASLGREKIMVMKGHREGIISFGKDLEEAANILIGKL